MLVTKISGMSAPRRAKTPGYSDLEHTKLPAIFIVLWKDA